MNRVKDKVIIITGGASGIGEATCRLLALEGGIIAVLDINQKQGENVVKKIQKSEGRGRFWKVDITQEDEVKVVFAEVYKTFGKIDVLVNNAGALGVDKPPHEIAQEEWESCIKLNLCGPFFCTKHVIPYMKISKHGSIINISSIFGIIGNPHFPPYHAAKGGIRCMTKTDAIYYAKDGIRVNSIHPGNILTKLLKDAAKTNPKGYKVSCDYMKSQIPLNCLGKPVDVAYGILYLASDESKYVTGSELVIDGGYLAQ